MSTSTPRVIAVANQKGGTGKSTITVNVAAAAGESGQRVLVVDVDPQADATPSGSTPHARELHPLRRPRHGGCDPRRPIGARRPRSADRASLAGGVHMLPLYERAGQHRRGAGQRAAPSATSPTPSPDHLATTTSSSSTPAQPRPATVNAFSPPARCSSSLDGRLAMLARALMSPLLEHQAAQQRPTSKCSASCATRSTATATYGSTTRRRRAAADRDPDAPAFRTRSPPACRSCTRATRRADTRCPSWPPASAARSTRRPSTSSTTARRRDAAQRPPA